MEDTDAVELVLNLFNAVGVLGLVDGHVAVELVDAVERECERVFRDDLRSSGGGRGRGRQNIQPQSSRNKPYHSASSFYG